MNKVKRMLALLIAVVMIVGIMPAIAMADNEPNDSKTDADTIEFGRTARGTFESAGDMDYYRFTVDTDSTVQLSYTSYGGYIDEDVSLKIMDASGTIMAEERIDSWSGSNRVMECDVYEGTYYVVLKDVATSNIEIYSYLLELNYVRDTGLYLDDGVWRYYEDGSFKKATGLVQRPDTGNWNYVENGVYKKVSGMVQCVQPGSNEGRWYYVENGAYRKKTGMVQCVQPGSNKGKWYFVENGIYRKKTGMVQSIQPGDTNGRWYFVEKGIYSKKTGMAQSIQPGNTKGNWYFIESGIYRKKTGMAQSIQPGSTNGRWYYVESGIYRKKTGVVQSIQPGSTKGRWYYVEKGMYTKKTGTFKRISDGKSVYVKKGIATQ